MIRDKASGAPRGYAFLTYAHPLAAATAMQHMNHQVRVCLAAATPIWRWFWC